MFEHEGGDGHRAIVLLTDGERSEGNLDRPLEKLGEAQIPVFAYGIGTPAGGFVPADPEAPSDSASRWHRDNIGRPAESRLDEKTLRRVTETSGGAYARWDDRAARKELVAAIRKVAERPLGTQRVPQHVELFQWPLAVALLFLALETPLRRSAGRRRAAPALVAALLRHDGGMRRRERRLPPGRAALSQEPVPGVLCALPGSAGSSRRIRWCSSGPVMPATG